MQDRLGGSPAYQLLHTFWMAVDWLYPPQCGGCQRPGIRWCADCEAKTEIIDHNLICPICGIPQAGMHPCVECQANKPSYKAMRSWAVYQGAIRGAIRRMKYRSDMGLSETFAQYLSNLIVMLDWPIDFVTVVPLGQRRRKERGYNQADLLARSVALAINRPYQPAAIKRRRETRSQVGLSAIERHQNVQDAFAANPEIVCRKNILIVDDVTTTGATMNECSRACMEKNAKNVYGITIARAVILEQP